MEGREAKHDEIQYAYYKKCGNLSESASILYYVRCGFAHGSFTRETTGNCTLYRFESRKKGVLNGFLRVSESTLMEWASFILAGPKKNDKNPQNRKKKKIAITV